MGYFPADGGNSNPTCSHDNAATCSMQEEDINSPQNSDDATTVSGKESEPASSSESTYQVQ